LAVHHLDGRAKQDLFHRVAAALHDEGRFVLADVVKLDDPADAVTPIEAPFDKPSGLGEQLAWLGEAGLATHVSWQHKDLAVITADKRTGDEFSAAQ
jgi:tRNA (cmo5U34)-methyltransferase